MLKRNKMESVTTTSVCSDSSDIEFDYMILDSDEFLPITDESVSSDTFLSEKALLSGSLVTGKYFVFVNIYNQLTLLY